MGDGVERTPDGRFVVVEGRRWRAADPLLPEEVREALVGHLMAARRAVGAAGRAGEAAAVAAARERVGVAKRGLGERGTAWWELEPAQRRERWEWALSVLDGDGADGDGGAEK